MPPASDAKPKRLIRRVASGSDLSADRRCSLQGTNSSTMLVNISIQPKTVNTVANRIADAYTTNAAPTAILNNTSIKWVFAELANLLRNFLAASGMRTDQTPRLIIHVPARNTIAPAALSIGLKMSYSPPFFDLTRYRLSESKRVAARIVYVELPKPPCLIDRAIVNRRVRVVWDQ